MKKIDAFKIMGFLRGASAIAIGMLTILGMLYTDSFEALCAVLFIGSILLVMSDNYFSK